MSSSESLALSAKRDKQAKREVPKAINEMTQSYVAAIAQRRKGIDLTEDYISDLRTQIEGMMRAAAS